MQIKQYAKWTLHKGLLWYRYIGERYIKHRLFTYPAIGLLTFTLLLTFILNVLPPHFLETFKNAATAITTLTAIWVAIVGLFTWKEQLKGKLNYELATRLLKVVYEYQGAIEFLRLDVIYDYEMPELSEAEKMTHTEVRYQERLHVYQNRWEKILQVRPQLQAAIIEVKAFWGKEAAAIVSELLRWERMLLLHFSRYFHNLKSPSRPYKDKDLKYALDNFQDDDEFKVEFNKVIIQIETLTAPYII